MTSCGSDLQTQSHAPGELPEDGPFKIQSPLADISSIAEAESQTQIQGASRPDFPEGEGTAGAEGETAGLKTSGDTASTTSDTERSDDGKDKDTKKIQTTATTQVCLCVFIYLDFSFHTSLQLSCGITLIGFIMGCTRVFNCTICNGLMQLQYNPHT